MKSEKQMLTEFGAFVVDKFTEQCMAMAEENWGPSHVADLKRLMTAVLTGKKYDKITDKEIFDVWDLKEPWPLDVLKEIRQMCEEAEE